MSSLRNSATAPPATAVSVTEDTLSVELADGRSVSVPIEWYPRLAHATQQERDEWQLIGDGLGIHWPQIDEDIQTEAIVFGIRSQESAGSLQRWLEARRTAG